VSAPYSPAHDRGISWIDKDIAIDWPVAPADAVLSAKDLALPALTDLPDCFTLER
jgi:dTDP-4-dehydrorhamnose 3,5-epimerase